MKTSRRDALLAPFGDAYYAMWSTCLERLKAMDSKQLAQVVEAAENLTTKNCRWVDHAICDEMLLDEARMQLRFRQAEEGRRLGDCHDA